MARYALALLAAALSANTCLAQRAELGFDRREAQNHRNLHSQSARLDCSEPAFNGCMKDAGWKFGAGATLFTKSPNVGTAVMLDGLVSGGTCIRHCVLVTGTETRCLTCSEHGPNCNCTHCLNHRANCVCPACQEHRGRDRCEHCRDHAPDCRCDHCRDHASSGDHGAHSH